VSGPSEPGLCAVCHGSARQIVQTQTLALLNRDAPCTIHFSACRTCGHLQQWPPVPPDLMAYHYRTFASYELVGEIETLKAAAPSRHAARLLSLARDIGLQPGRAYEVGCASGEMLNQFAKVGWQVGGCEPSPSALAQAKDIFRIEADLGGEEDALPRQQNLDLVLLCHVLEHLYDPAASLRRICDALGANGHLLLEVPCATAPDMLPPGWFTFEHLHYYRLDILERLLRQAGFEIVESRIAMKCENYPVIAIAARKTEGAAPATAMDPEAAIMMSQHYAARDARLWAETDQRLAACDGPVFVYGAGIHTAQLLENTGLSRRNALLAVVDRDAKKWGQNLAGIPVISPEQLLRDPRTAPVIVSSYGSEKAIAATLAEKGLAASRIVTLYSGRC
jgi:SAM-dependent methyltransferase